MTRGGDLRPWAIGMSLLALAVAVAAASPATAQTREQNQALCSAQDAPLLTIEACTALLRSGPDPTSLFNRGRAYLILDNYDHAIADFTEVIRLDPRDASALYHRGMARFGAGCATCAIADFDASIAINPRDWRPFNGRAAAYGNLKDYARALADYNEAARLDPQNQAVLFWRGVTYVQLKDYGPAIASLDDAIRLNAGFAPAFNERCWARALWGRDLDLALADCDEALRLHPDDASTHVSRGLVQLKRGAFAAAVADYDAAIKARPDRGAGALYGRGVARKRLGETGAGQADMDAAIALDPGIAAKFAGYGVVP